MSGLWIIFLVCVIALVLDTVLFIVSKRKAVAVSPIFTIMFWTMFCLTFETLIVALIWG